MGQSRFGAGMSGNETVIAGIPLGSPGATNMVRIAFIDERGAPIAEEV